MGINVCNPKERTFKPTKTWTGTDGELIWDIGVSVESKNRNFKDEDFKLVLKRKPSGSIASIFNKLDLVNITVKK